MAPPDTRDVVRRERRNPTDIERRRIALTAVAGRLALMAAQPAATDSGGDEQAVVKKLDRHPCLR